MSFKKYIKKYAFLIIILAMIIFAANISRKTSSLTLTRYRTSTSGTDAARVAKWEIEAVSRKEGENIEIDSNFRNSITEGEGNWAFEFSNNSEVNAFIDGSTKIVVRLDNDNFNSTSPETISWNFINDTSGSPTTNPITFEIKMYSGSINDVICYKNNKTTISYNNYYNLSETEKKDYKQVLNESNVKDIKHQTLLELNGTSDDQIEFKRNNETINSKVIYFYYYEIELNKIIADADNILKSDFAINMKNLENNNYVTFVIDWKVDTNTTGSSTESGSSSTTESSDEVKYYHAYKLSTDIPSDYEGTKYIIEGNKYYIKDDALDYYEYTNYANGLIGNEPTFEFKLSGSNETMKIKYSNLTAEQIGIIINSYKDISQNPTLEELKHYIEYLEYTQYTEYRDDVIKQQAALGYLTYGLKVNLKFNIHISQKEPK